MERLIHIHAKCNAFEIFEYVPEDKAVKRLKNIRSSFGKSQKHYGYSVTGNLKVSTVVVNPELPLKH